MAARRMPSLAALTRRFRRAKGGIAGIEFALMFPILLIVIAASIDLSEALAARRKTTYIASALAGFLADQNHWTKAEVEDLLTAGNLILAPFETDGLKIVLSVLEVSADKKVKVAASYAQGTAALSIGSASPIAISADILTPNVHIVLAQVDYALATPFSTLWPVYAVEDRFEFSAHSVARPRRSDKITIK